MVFLYIASIASVLCSIFVIWYIIFCYSNKWIATFITMIIIAISATIFVNWLIKPTDKDIQEHIDKSLHI